MTERIFLAVVGVAYLILAIWCSVRPAQTSQAVGFSLTPGSGQSEYFVVYGGMEFGLGIVFLLPLLHPEQASFALLACLIIHACLVLFRSLSFFQFDGIQMTTYFLAAVEWLIFLGALAVTLLRGRIS
jgi:hypothetical protein